MREIANRLEHLGCINRDIRLAIAMTGPHCDRLVTLRADFSFECSQLLNQLTARLATTEHARIASRILDAFVTMQQSLGQHQQQWTTDEIRREPEGYIAASFRVHTAVINFLEDALDGIENAVFAARGRRSAPSAFAGEADIRLTRAG